MDTTSKGPGAYLSTLSSVGRGYSARLVQVRGWVVCGIALLPVLLVLAVTLALGASRHGSTSLTGLQVYHFVLAMAVVPILALVAAPAGVPEDLEQRTLPLLLVRPSPAGALPLARGLPWFLWGALWLAVASLGLGLLAPQDLAARAAALVMAFWAELAFVTLMVLVFKRGIVWAALVLLVWDPLVQFLPGNLQRLTFIHYVQSIAGSRGSGVGAQNILAQEQISTPLGLALLVLLLFGAACWALCGWKLQATPVGLAGPEGEG
jgi:hypothetical protein